ncbi:aminoacyl tRNA synthase complex-interacting multifunctional protein 1-like [Scleropages formosus]|uniref:Aminoacyl tRNA synthetase complex interacting multifunctional protein 1 n=1 Tax=Scleropages formosus TaxID=113540 RepID=A0A8C9RU93_SCLFO|nr:aminoacyl tRNA synthase complex-interacting multifunctional protein 1-like [Scleropages formosus]
MDQKTGEADQIMEYFKQQVLLLKEKALLQASIREEKKLLVENAKLKKDIEELKKILFETQKKRGAKQAAMPLAVSSAQCAPTPSTSAPPATDSTNVTHKDSEGRRRRAERKAERMERRKEAAAFQTEETVDVSRLDIRVGRIITATKHPDADSLYVEQVDVGEASPRTVVSGLVKYISLEQMENRMAVLLCNLKPCKMRGVVSQAMVLCATSPEKAEMLEPPSGAIPGDRVTIQSSIGEPDRELNPKKKVWEQVQAHLRTDSKCVAVYKGAALEIRGKGYCKAQTMSDCSIK